MEKLNEPVSKIKDLNIFDAEAWVRKNPLTPNQCYSPRQYALNIAAKVPVTCLQELFDNAEKIQEWLKEPTTSINDEQINNYFDCSAV